MKKSPRTKHMQRMSRITGILSFLLMVGPVIFFFIQSMLYCAETKQKLVMGAIFMCVLIMAICNILMKYKPRSPFWLLLLGLQYTLNKIEIVIIVMAITTIIDECVISPLHHYAKRTAATNKEIDHRG